MSTVDEAHTAPPVTHAGPEPEEPRHRSRPVWLVLAAAFIAAAAGTGAWVWASNTATEPASAASGPVATAVVERGTIAATESWDGTLDHGTPFTVTSGTGGTITRLAEQGETVARGDELYRVDERPVTLLYGVVPMYRDLGPGASGADVKQLETNLAELGYGRFAVDNQYSSSTADAVRAWQEVIGAGPTGMVARGDIVFLPEGRRVDTLRANVGDVVGPGTAILDITGTAQVVSVEAEVVDRDRFEIDTKVTLVLPGGDEVAGTVTATAVVEALPEEGAEAAADTEPILQAEIALNEKAPDEFVGGPVDVVVAIDERTDVLMVPVNALLALSEGGFGLEVAADDGSTSIVPVETGLFGEGKVEIKSADIAEGMVVGVAGR
ncbi:MAG: efflux RND transporter periplasmic adaptor subunit [Nitriliruptorales bacterium]|nr:efflux RND transporter periplasmic adaptor subunit [Nitriliruptorales bacterium]